MELSFINAAVPVDAMGPNSEEDLVDGDTLVTHRSLREIGSCNESALGPKQDQGEITSCAVDRCRSHRTEGDTCRLEVIVARELSGDKYSASSAAFAVFGSAAQERALHIWAIEEHDHSSALQTQNRALERDERLACTRRKTSKRRRRAKKCNAWIEEGQRRGSVRTWSPEYTCELIWE